MAIQWLRCGHHVYVVSTWWGSRAVCKMLYHILQTVNTQHPAVASSGQIHLLEFDFPKDKDMEKAVNDLSQAANGGPLYIIADEAGPENTSVCPVDSSDEEQSEEDKANDFGIFCGKLLAQVPRLHLWAASCFHGLAPVGWQVEYLTRPLRSPPTVVRELQKTWKQNNRNQKKRNQTTYNQKAQNYELSSQVTDDQKVDNQRKEDHVADDQEIDSQDTYNQATDNQKTDRQETDSQKTNRQETNNQKTQNQETVNEKKRSQKASNQQPVCFVHPYSERGFPDHTDGPPVRRLYHGGQGHSGNNAGSCATCGHEVASFLHSLHAGVAGVASTTIITTSSGTLKSCMQWRDMLVLYYWRNFTEDSGIVTGLREKGIPVRLMKDEDTNDVATAHSDVVWVADGERVRGLERKVVVCVDPRVETVRLHHMSRCTSQLVIVLVDDEPSVSNISYLARDAAFLQLNTTDLTKTGLEANSFFDL
ncbi:uncharacterized protein LOC112575993 [Pomacea canaliculata]|uniref:uncharacterized protein LOC112575993 n=1 Tax=Pomacea canaliculata TaxID=400727 RepID=UPI000D726984|nr:uncharacterized protein LOC112575993 [Pomacea canaliculata]